MSELRVAGLFAGIGGIELGLQQAGHRSELLCELDPGARHVLETHFPGVELTADVTELDELPEVDLVSAGFPCQDLSQAGGKRGIGGTKSSVVEHLFRLLNRSRKLGRQPSFVLIENVSYMLRLDRGRAMDFLVQELESLGYRWAYRVVDCRAFGIPQRRQRVVMLAALHHDPAALILGSDSGEPAAVDSIGPVDPDSTYGFYWTEGKRGLGWARDAIPTLKGGSGIGIPSPPAVWTPKTAKFGTPTLGDSERLQGFPRGWTEPADTVYSRPRRYRWPLVGNAVCVPMARWVGQRLSELDDDPVPKLRSLTGERWPRAACGGEGKRLFVDVSMRPTQSEFVPLGTYLEDPLVPLSHRAASGFLSRARTGKLRFAEGFLDDLDRYIVDMSEDGNTSLRRAA